MSSEALCLGFAGFLATVSLLLGCLGCAVICPPYGLVVYATTRSFSLSEDFALDSLTADPAPAVEQAAKSLGYRVSWPSEEAEGAYSPCVTYEKKSPFLIWLLCDYEREVTLTIVSGRRQQKLQLSVTVTGSFGAGSERDAQKALQAFKNKLQECLSAQRRRR